jgi:hypothetical protein
MLAIASLVPTAPVSDSAETLSRQRAKAFETVYHEKRWTVGGDGALCTSGWSAVDAGQATGAVAAVKQVLSEHDIRVILDIPAGDGCFAQGMLSRVRQNRSLEYIGGCLPCGAVGPCHSTSKLNTCARPL